MKRPNSVDSKQCPFCGETIRMEAIKCRFCAEFLNDDHAGIEPTSRFGGDADKRSDADETDSQDEGILYFGSPSVLSMMRTFVKFILFIAVAVVLLVLPLEDYLQKAVGERGGMTDNHHVLIEAIRHGAGIVLIVLAVLWLFWKIAVLKSTYYEVTADRIEWARGVFNRKVDNIDMFRIVDLSLQRTFFDCIFGIGTVHVITSDKTDPNFAFYKVPDARYLYDTLKHLSTGADQKRGVVHLE
ncbi:Bacterial membrane flanked domain protein [Anaerohalosphaera lusitana]|uniref:Bacterial membrane flanked domain protein n=1 Tax=Anaerohalosphaera lusitana TaxID=1936003 RepID=A0A1U9NHK0_9BACT|nr:PH domain-containing protein [Anaerohalosphaera lusitana]AQT67285.1 Bacterial membrane flanked domain protein [Anaerohalosphaera lusitana]